jgi:hypothetical protein
VAAFDWLAEQTDIHGNVLPRDLLVQSFVFNGQRVPLLSPLGDLQAEGGAAAAHHHDCAELTL